MWTMSNRGPAGPVQPQAGRSPGELVRKAEIQTQTDVLPLCKKTDFSLLLFP